MNTTLPAKGERYTIHRSPGYKLIQDRPHDCRRGRCVCGTCNGTPTGYPGTVVEVPYFADNSIEVVVACDDGETRRDTLKPPSGDLC